MSGKENKQKHFNGIIQKASQQTLYFENICLKPILHHKHLKFRVMMMHRPLPAQMCTHQEAQLRLSSVTATLTNEGSACVHGHYSELAARSALALQRLNKGDFTC